MTHRCNITLAQIACERQADAALAHVIAEEWERAGFPGLARFWQRKAAMFAERARDLLFVLIDAEPEIRPSGRNPHAWELLGVAKEWSP